MELTFGGPRRLSPNLSPQPEGWVSGFLTQLGTHLNLMLWVAVWALEPQDLGSDPSPTLTV